MDDILDRFSPATRAWFRAAFAAPTAAQRGAWEAIGDGGHVLVVAPTGSGKTLSAFLSAIDAISSAPPEDLQRRCRLVYVSPMKALGVDVERNLRAPLVGIAHAARRLGVPPPELTVAVRSGDTPADQRRAFARRPSDILITTPESLFLLLTSSSREALTSVETVILDEVHAVAGTKRGAHLALSLERLDALLDRPAQRIGLSATVRPVEEVARFLGGGQPVSVVAPPQVKEWDLRVVVPVPDLSDVGAGEPPASASPGDDDDVVRVASIWPHVEERIVDLVAAHRSTLVFANSRRLAERLTARLNEIWHERLDAAEAAAEVTDLNDPSLSDRARSEATDDTPGSSWSEHRPPALVMGQAGSGRGAPPVLARAHHGSVSKENRALIEDDLKAGRLPAVVATSSLELGIDMGAVDLVVQVESPPSVSSGLQRVGRAGHQVGAVSHGVIFPAHRSDLLQTAVVVERMRSGAIEALTVPSTPLDVLAQHVVAMCALDDWPVEELFALARRAAPYAALSRPVLDAVLDMLAGRYPSEDFAELRPRIVWDRLDDVVTGRPGAQRLAVTSGGTIPDRGLFGVFLASGDGPGRRVGELDEEMVYESRVGDVFTLGTSSWRIEDITHDRVLVTPAPGRPGRLPFWHGDTLGRPAELGMALGGFVRELGALPPSAAQERVTTTGLDEWATGNLLTYLDEQRSATGHLPDDRTVVIERFRDELGDWRVVIHSPHGASVHAPWALCAAARLRERYDVDPQAMHGDDGIVLRLPDVDLDDRESLAEVASLLVLDPAEVADLVTREIGGSALFAARFRECAARALLLPRRRPDRRQALWQQRQRAAQLLAVASRYPEFPIVLETVRECLQDVYDVPGLTALMRRIATREMRVVTVDTPTPSPFARSLLFGYVAQFLYEGDSPLAERRAAALSLDPSLLAELLGRGDGAELADLLDPVALARTEAELQWLAPDRQARSVEDVADLVRRLGPLTLEDATARCGDQVDAAAALHDLAAARRVVELRIAGQQRWAAVEDAARLRDAVGVALPVGLPPTLLDPVPDPVGDLVARYARTRGPFTSADVAAWLGIGSAVATDALTRLTDSGRITRGRLRPPGTTPPGGVRPRPEALDFCDTEVLRILRRRSLAAARAEVEPVSQTDFARFLPLWQGVGGAHGGVEGVLRTVELLDGAQLPASAIESLVLPARVRDYTPAMLDELMAAGEVLWQGHAALPADDGWVSLHRADSAPLTLTPPDEEISLTDAHLAVLELLDGGGAYFVHTLADHVGARLDRMADGAVFSDADLTRVIWDLVWGGWIGNDGLTPLRTLLRRGRGAHRPRASGRPTGRYGGRRLSRFDTPRRGGSGPGGSAGAVGSARARSARFGPAELGGRWFRLPALESDPTTRALAGAEVLLDRHGILTRGAVTAETGDGFSGLYRVLAAAEDAGRIRRGYFVEGLGAAQFASAAAVDRLRAGSRPLPDPGPVGTATPDRGDSALILAATDPANPYGAALPWPERTTNETILDGAASGHRPGRKAGALVALVTGRLVLYVERGGRTVLSFTDDADELALAAQGLAATVRLGAIDRLTVERVDGERTLGSEHPLVSALEAAGFHVTPRGLRIRRP